MKLCKMIFISTIILFFMCSCESWLTGTTGDSSTKKEESKKEEPTYVQDKIWVLDTNSYYNSWFNRQYDKYFYILEYADEDKSKNVYFYSKIDLSNGERVWSTPVFNESMLCYPVIGEVNGKKYMVVLGCSNENGNKIRKLLMFSDATGDLSASIQYYDYDVPENKQEYIINCNIMCVGNSLYWPTSPTYYRGMDLKTETNLIRPGIAKLDLSEIDFSKPADELQYVQPTMVWTNKENYGAILVYPVVKNGVIYFITRSREITPWTEFDCTIRGAYDTKTDCVLWEKKSEKHDGEGFNNMLIVGDRLYIMGRAQGCYNLSDGSIVWEQRQTVEEMHSEVGIDASLYSLGITYFGGKIYFTNTGGCRSSEMTGIDNDLIKNIQCIDASDGKYLWGDLPDGSGSLCTRPIVIDNQCFVMGWDNLRIYNATTGELIGVDNSVKSIGQELNAEYDGMFIYFDTDESTLTSKLTAIKPHWDSETLK